LDIKLPDDRVYDGIDLLPLIEVKTKTRTQPIGYLNRGGSEAVWMEERYKLIETSRSVRLYDIPADAGEKKDLAGSLPKVKKRMQTALAAWKAGVMKELKAVAN
jgi:hypothetical protein